jgi:thioredoxin 1
MITSSELFEQSLDAGLVVVDFQAEWCGPCKTMAPLVEELDTEMPDVTFVAIDVDAEPALSQEFAVQSIPTFLFLRAGHLVDRVVGALPKEQLRLRIDHHLSVTPA